MKKLLVYGNRLFLLERFVTTRLNVYVQCNTVNQICTTGHFFHFLKILKIVENDQEKIRKLGIFYTNLRDLVAALNPYACKPLSIFFIYKVLFRRNYKVFFFFANFDYPALQTLLVSTYSRTSNNTSRKKCSGSSLPVMLYVISFS